MYDSTQKPLFSMKRLFPALVLSSLLLPSLASAQALTDVYGDSIYAEGAANIVAAENAVGAPDGLYADFHGKDTFFTVDMGEGEEGFGDLIVTMKVFQEGTNGRATLYDADWNVLTVSWPPPFPESMTSWVVPYSGETPYRYVKIESTYAPQWSVDALRATQVNTPAEPPAEEPVAGEEVIPYCTLSDCSKTAILLKTTDDSAIYFVGRDGKRHTFPNPETLLSWSYSIDQIFGLIVDEPLTLEQLNAYPLGKNMTIRPGTYMVKIVHDPKVYAVEPGGVLRWIQTEAIAAELYGDDWNKQIVDIDETFWKNYSVGAPVTDSFDPPIGYFFADHDRHYIMTKDGARELNEAEIIALHMNRTDDPFVGSYDVSALVATEGLADNSDLTVFVEAY